MIEKIVDLSTWWEDCRLRCNIILVNTIAYKIPLVTTSKFDGNSLSLQCKNSTADPLPLIFPAGFLSDRIGEISRLHDEKIVDLDDFNKLMDRHGLFMVTVLSASIDTAYISPTPPPGTYTWEWSQKIVLGIWRWERASDFNHMCWLYTFSVMSSLSLHNNIFGPSPPIYLYIVKIENFRQILISSHRKRSYMHTSGRAV